MPTPKPNFAKEPSSPSRSKAGLRNNANLIYSMIENNNRQCLTAGINNLAISGLRRSVLLFMFVVN